MNDALHHSRDTVLLCRTMRKLSSAFILICLFVISVGGDCGKKTAEPLAHSSTIGSVNGGVARSLRGRVLFPDGKEADSMIVEVYRNDSTIPPREITHDQVEAIVNRGRLAAVNTGNSGKFCFKNLKPGRYILRANVAAEHVSLSQYSMINVFVTIAPKNKRAKRSLDVTLEMAI